VREASTRTTSPAASAKVRIPAPPRGVATTSAAERHSHDDRHRHRIAARVARVRIVVRHRQAALVHAVDGAGERRGGERQVAQALRRTALAHDVERLRERRVVEVVVEERAAALRARAAQRRRGAGAGGRHVAPVGRAEEQLGRVQEVPVGRGEPRAARDGDEPRLRVRGVARERRAEELRAAPPRHEREQRGRDERWAERRHLRAGDHDLARAPHLGRERLALLRAHARRVARDAQERRGARYGSS
jgi:hypothetical protein